MDFKPMLQDHLQSKAGLRTAKCHRDQNVEWSLLD